MPHHIAYTVYDSDCVGIATLLQHRRIHASLSIDAYNVRLDLLRILRITDIRNSNNRVTDNLEGQLIDFADVGKLAVRIDAVIHRADRNVSRGKNQIRP